MSIHLLAQVVVCAYLTGVLWIIQVIHYPTFAVIDAASFAAFHGRHTRAMTALVGVAMLADLGLALSLFAVEPNPSWLVNLVGATITFALTFLVSVPLHNRLARGSDANVIRRLVLTNWPRTLVWTARLILLTYLAGGATC